MRSLKNLIIYLGLVTLLFSLLVFLSGCSNKIPNVEGCIELLSGKARCRTLVTEDVREIDEFEWEFERIGRTSFSPKDTGRIITFIEQVCQKIKCTKEEEKEVKIHAEKWREFMAP